ncbi:MULTISPECIES: ABC transporter ATP-binding protein [Bacillus cereus group]|uniref:ABC transporter ATP-binding protein n=1 Tax=Bacillus cereus group TaxID=86661 RepID=UPI0009433E49|nr:MULTISPECIES: ABC transporter ATP-binding protein [Bacillus cereus group]MDA2635685.1 ABC transporter ATP-binding protein [Bacillus cereus]NUH89642.1 ABC transporter ATP-binding protein [Bacillus thuringiensis]NUH95197.1 ABC transporter ATP-binding protein [Bacillus thuringiensis]NUI00791.1 ABC transporter ATP-binding protein [Bacillus thuringiensis]NUI05362.1 ABC transporter ATP-binding protein [Bacillus thuringiensis]
MKEKRHNQFWAFIKTQKYFLGYIYREHPLSLILFCILSLITATIPPILIILNKQTIDTITNIHNNPDAQEVVIILLVVTFLLQYFSSVLSNIGIYIFTRITQTVNYVLKKIMLTKLIKIPLKEYEDSSFFDTINLANIAISGNGVRVISSLIGVLQSLISLIGICGILLAIHWILPIALFLSTLPGIILIFIAKSKNYRMTKETAAKDRELGFTDNLFVDKSAIREIKINDSGDFLLNKWSNLFKVIQKYKLNLALWECKTKSIAALLLQVSSLVVSLILVYQIFDNKLSIGDYVALLGAVASVQSIFGSIGSHLGSIFETAIYNSALMQILDYDVKNKKEVDPIEIQSVEEISLKNISFYYPKTNVKVLDNINLKINKGENISIVGHNGSGKTTLVKCILGLYDVSDGEIRVNEKNIKDINKITYFERVAAIFQDFYKYKFSLRENLGFGNLKKLNDDQELYNALQKVGLYEKVKNYQFNLDTYLTREIPDGRELSGGEWQKLAIARGFLKDSDLIILDEPTAALDPLSEMKIFELFNKLSENKTTITISHRLGPTKYSDRIIVMDNGNIVEEGNYDELMNKRGVYYEMYLSQAKWYEEQITQNSI